jgi:hypothetical protein
VEAALADFSPKGIRVDLPFSLGKGSTVSVKGSVGANGSQRDVPEDYYDTLQLSPKADPDTIHRVFRLLAQRYHPDNADTGNIEIFRRILEAHQVLSDREKRAAYDVQREASQGHRWRIFTSAQATLGPEAERRKRQAILMLLYTKRLNSPDQATLTMREMEDLLGIPSEHLEFSLWYIKERGLAARGDSGRYQITVAGVDEAEKNPAPVCETPANRMLPAAAGPTARPSAAHTGPLSQ